jgi:hypothetical protein
MNETELSMSDFILILCWFCTGFYTDFILILNGELVSSGSKSLFVGDLQADKKFFSQKYGSKGSSKLTQVYQ